jgi:hypothetical protein
VHHGLGNTQTFPWTGWTDGMPDGGVEERSPTERCSEAAWLGLLTEYILPAREREVGDGWYVPLIFEGRTE